MEKHQELYEQYISKLRKAEPLLEHPEKLTRRITDQLENIPQLSGFRRFRVLKSISGIAAFFVICWMLSEAFPVQDNKLQLTQPMESVFSHPVNYQYHTLSYRIQQKKKLNYFLRLVQKTEHETNNPY